MPFLGFGVKFEEKNRGFWSKNCGFEREREAEKTETCT